MSARDDGAKAVGVGAVLCAACCAGPIVGWLTAIGVFTVAGFAWFGVAALLIGAVAVAWVLRRRRRAAACAVPATESAPVSLELSSRPSTPPR